MGKKRSKKIPDGKELLADLAGRLDVHDMRLIAACDYGRDVEKHLEPLLRIKNTLDTSGLDLWYPLEVIELCRWYPPPMASTLKRHEMRAFSCVILLDIHCNSDADATSVDSTLGNLLESLLCLDESLVSKGNGLCKALLQSDHLEDGDKVFIPIFQLLETLRSKDETDVRLRLDVLLNCEKKYTNELSFPSDESYGTFSERGYIVQDAGWRFVSNYIYETLPSIKDVELKDDLLELCKRFWNPEPETYVPVPLKP